MASLNSATIMLLLSAMLLPGSSALKVCVVLEQSLTMARQLAVMQLHPAKDDPSELVRFAALYDDHSKRGFINKMWVIGRLRHMDCIKYFENFKIPMHSQDECVQGWCSTVFHSVQG